MILANLSSEKDSTYRNEVADLFELNKKSSLVDLAMNSIRTTKDVISSKDTQINRENKWLNKHIYAFHEKFTLGFACIILFFVGAPLGALIKKGGLGLPMVIAIFLFLTYHFIGLFAKNSGYNGKIDPAFAAWLPTMIMLPLSIYLTRTATFDKPIVNFNFIAQPIKRLFKTKELSVEDQHALLDSNSPELSILKNHDSNKLIDIIKNYHQYDYPISYRNSSVQILNNRGISEEELKFSGNLSNQVYEDAKRALDLQNENSKIALVSYVSYMLFTILALVFNNNKLPALAVISIILVVIFVVAFLVYLIKVYTNLSDFYKIIDKKNVTNILGIAIIGIPLYFLVYFYYNKKLIEDIKLIN